jgi:DNA-binding XRE family transcriptional regulator
LQKTARPLQTVINNGSIMDKSKRKKLGEKGFRVGSAADFLELTPEEETYIEIRLDISSLVKTQRAKRDWTQEQLARAIGSSQSRIAKLENGDPGISLDLMIKALLRLGTSKKQIGKLLEGELKPA